MLAKGVDPLDESSVSMNLVAACAIVETFISVYLSDFRYFDFSLRDPLTNHSAKRAHDIGKPTVCTRSLKRGSSRSGSRQGSTAR